ncbi:hypothetical protein HMPREF1146_2669 [Prevotella sp. MSX73]|uniref:Uncharacterized protein n=1 Tax=Segatella buccae ATCC 33574 TaxID=873513 RepID=E6K6X0_9BACT|nr:hypothetical protein HMPREF6485_1370 [Segatella buccae ATCC 33574]EJP31020.1 hypothetical protein HMPREF1146_2669 [Prevotella sp. MSX73]
MSHGATCANNRYFHNRILFNEIKYVGCKITTFCAIKDNKSMFFLLL